MRQLLLAAVRKAPLLTESQIKVVSDVGIAAGQLTLGGMVLPFVMPGLDEAKLRVVVLGAIFTTALWGGSVLLVRKIKE